MSFLLFPDIPNKADTLARQRPDQVLGRAAVADRRSCGIDPAAQRRFGHDAPLPHGVEQVIPAGHAVSCADQELQEIEHLRFELNVVARPVELPTVGVEHEVIKQVAHGEAPAGSALEQVITAVARAKTNPLSPRNQGCLTAPRS